MIPFFSYYVIGKVSTQYCLIIMAMLEKSGGNINIGMSPGRLLTSDSVYNSLRLFGNQVETLPHVQHLQSGNETVVLQVLRLS